MAEKERTHDGLGVSMIAIHIACLVLTPLQVPVGGDVPYWLRAAVVIENGLQGRTS